MIKRKNIEILRLFHHKSAAQLNQQHELDPLLDHAANWPKNFEDKLRSLGGLFLHIGAILKI